MYSGGNVQVKTSVRNFIITFFAALLLFSLAADGVSNFVIDEITQSIDGTPAVSLEIITNTPDTQEDPGNVTDVFDTISGESFDFILIGTDYQPDIFDDYDIESTYSDSFPLKRNRKLSADTIAVVRFDKEGKKILISSIPASMSITNDGLQTTLGELFGETYKEYIDSGKDQYLIDFTKRVSGITGFELEKYFIIDVRDLSSVINEIGGVDFDVPEDMNYEDPSQDLLIDLKAGYQHIDGEKAEQLLRYNNYFASSNSREKTTMQFL